MHFDAWQADGVASQSIALASPRLYAKNWIGTPTNAFQESFEIVTQERPCSRVILVYLKMATEDATDKHAFKERMCPISSHRLPRLSFEFLDICTLNALRYVEHFVRICKLVPTISSSPESQVSHCPLDALPIGWCKHWKLARHATDRD